MAVGIIVNLEAPGMAIDPTSSLLFPVSIPAQMRGDFFIFHDPALGIEPDVQATLRVRRRAEDVSVKEAL